jgi:hypothetical protein
MADILIPAVTIPEPTVDGDHLEICVKQWVDENDRLQRRYTLHQDHPRRSSMVAWSTDGTTLDVPPAMTAALNALLDAMTKSEDAKVTMGFAKDTRVVEKKVEE